MASYVVGDVQGCFTTLTRLLTRVAFDAARDRLLFVGDLVNRGPNSLEVLRFVRELGESATMVLGNHELHLIGCARGTRSPRRRDTLDAVLDAPDRDELVDWLVDQPFLYRDDELVMVHAGLLPSWTLEEAEQLAKKAAERFRDDRLNRRTREAIDAFTRIRTATSDGELRLDFSGPPRDAPPGYRPWFELVELPEDVKIVFGHWASLGLYIREQFFGLDTGCVWGGALTALRWDDRKIFQEPSELSDALLQESRSRTS